ncbi:ABC transporter substrate-binding protein [Thiohalobacter sp. IOR34]|uniref:MlaC/ttg2D family ABC transporter substrate-binding protein n=1 Tax=Thiohalobacter sp. IOR34 TaxID=3057176 RepID=UPI0025B0F2C5|nr:ABC transporter substrate-binding protein [Thiohalobacter sp. IOR34]WJW74848.1 ABC transporter substrate-binding protein [Thiohalobacter sp. IOR34]
MIARLGRWMLLIWLLLTTGAVLAVEDPAPLQLVKQTSDRMLTVLRAERELLRREPERLYGLVEDIVLPHFDFERMGRWVLGKYWRRATPAQRQRFVEAFRNLLVRTYGTALLEYRDETIRYLPFRMAPDDTRVTVRTEVLRPGGQPIPINYSMYLAANGWKVDDISIDGISLVSNYRSTFAAEIRQHGLDGLIARLEEMNRKAAEHSPGDAAGA